MSFINHITTQLALMSLPNPPLTDPMDDFDESQTQWTCSICGVLVSESNWYSSSYPSYEACSCCEGVSYNYDGVSYSPNWLHYYRGVIVDDLGNHTLTGIGRMKKWRENLRAPESKTAKYDDVPKPDSIAFRDVDIHTLRNKTESPHGYIAHTRCWDLFHLVLKRITRDGSIIPENRPQSFTRALVNLSSPSFFELTPNFFLDNGAWDRKFKLMDTSPQISPDNICDTTVISDPVDIPEVQEVIRRNKWNLRFTKNHGELKARELIYRLDVYLPLDVKCRIFDFLGYQDLKPALEEGKWGLPDYYWRGRIRGVFFEVNDHAHDKVDWQKLWLELEALTEDEDKLNHRVLNRRRILRILDKTCREFLRVDREGS